MNSSGISSNSFYKSSAAYDLNQLSYVQSRQEDSGAKISSKSDDEDIDDVALISDKAKELAAQDTSTETTDKTSPKSEDNLTPEQKQEVSKLKQRDAEVKAHEAAHEAAASGLSTSAPTYTYQTGPDGKDYAVGGEVNVTFEETGDPEVDLVNAEKLRDAALAPTDPSSQDRAVAENATKIIAKAEQELAQQKTEGTKSDGSSNETAIDGSKIAETAETASTKMQNAVNEITNTNSKSGLQLF